MRLACKYLHKTFPNTLPDLTANADDELCGLRSKPTSFLQTLSLVACVLLSMQEHATLAAVEAFYALRSSNVSVQFPLSLSCPIRLRLTSYSLSLRINGA